VSAKTRRRTDFNLFVGARLWHSGDTQEGCGKDKPGLEIQVWGTAWNPIFAWLSGGSSVREWRRYGF